ncbi:hypothetical protein TraAM80_01756 [Trypanosoma rangeli]|uniref:Uncharacterized protein n=1 Tax=Trypanosoma rangeli TaxID=5698 RepID=A0A3R7LA55_TRYRA|nr:uncharacterized protein TraAM80_01756 [Trypanosoma rangeli]RNF10178.1 hypothetical protein TraAM80_01756 [Trypanosoma rangeli]|eukprot:RNF10178.1 hypothetical protein TraAM80_01756 [Trypanosoma rangeli]
MEGQNSGAASLGVSAKNLYSIGQYNEVLSGCWPDSLRWQCLPSLMRAESAGSKRNNSPRHYSSLTASTEQQRQLPLCTDASGVYVALSNIRSDGGEEVPSAWRPAFIPPAGVSGPKQTQEKPVPPSPELPEKVKVSMSKRWTPYINGAVRRYKVPSKVGIRRDVAEATRGCPFRYLEEMAQVHAEEMDGRRRFYDVIVPQLTLPTQFVLHVPDADSRRVADEAHPKAKMLANAEASMELLRRRVLFDTTLGAVKPYALGESRDCQKLQQKRRKMRPGETPLFMPPSALSQDPMVVFAEAMRYQRPGLGIYSFDVY